MPKPPADGRSLAPYLARSAAPPPRPEEAPDPVTEDFEDECPVCRARSCRCTWWNIVLGKKQ